MSTTPFPRSSKRVARQAYASRVIPMAELAPFLPRLIEAHGPIEATGESQMERWPSAFSAAHRSAAPMKHEHLKRLGKRNSALAAHRSARPPLKR